MKFKKQKRQRRFVRFYSTIFGFHKPFKVLCDGTFIHHLLANRITSPDQALADILGGPTKLFTTKCVIAELKTLGPTYSQAFDAARNLIVARCDHEKRKNAAVCIKEVIGTHNSEHFFVATQDMDIRNTLEEVQAGIPVVYGLRNSLFLDPPSDAQRKFAVEMEKKRLHVTGSELELLSGEAPDTDQGLEDQDVNAKSLRRGNSARRAGAFSGMIRKKAKAPNPLSCKKKKNIGNPSSSSSQDVKDADNAGRKRNRKRKRSHKMTKTGETEG